MSKRYTCDVCGRGATHLNYNTNEGRCERHLKSLTPKQLKSFFLIKE